jgi:hypothetical protein
MEASAAFSVLELQVVCLEHTHTDLLQALSQKPALSIFQDQTMGEQIVVAAIPIPVTRYHFDSQFSHELPPLHEFIAHFCAERCGVI